MVIIPGSHYFLPSIGSAGKKIARPRKWRRGVQSREPVEGPMWNLPKQDAMEKDRMEIKKWRYNIRRNSNWLHAVSTPPSPAPNHSASWASHPPGTVMMMLMIRHGRCGGFPGSAWPLPCSWPTPPKMALVVGAWDGLHHGTWSWSLQEHDTLPCGPTHLPVGRQAQALFSLGRRPL